MVLVNGFSKRYLSRLTLVWVQRTAWLVVSDGGSDTSVVVVLIKVYTMFKSEGITL